MPVRYSSDLAEHHAVRTSAGLFDLSHMGEIVLRRPRGRPRRSTTRSPASSRRSRSARRSTRCCSPRTAASSTTSSSTAPATTATWSSRTRRTASVVADELRDARRRRSTRSSPTRATTSRSSPCRAPTRSRRAAARRPGFGVDRARATTPRTSSRASTRSSTTARSRPTFEGEPVLVARTGYTGEDGFELYIAPDQAPRACGTRSARPAARASCPAGSRAATRSASRRACRCTATSSSRDILPVQAGLGRVVALAKEGDFVGRAAIEQGPAADAPVLVGLAAEGRRAARADYEVYDGEGADAARVGVVTSGALSPTLGHPVAMAFVAPDAAEPGRELFVDVRGTRSRHPSSPCPSTSAPPDRRRRTDHRTHRPHRTAPHRPPRGEPHDRPDRTPVHRRARVGARRRRHRSRSASPTTPPRSSATSSTSTCPPPAPRSPPATSSARSSRPSRSASCSRPSTARSSSPTRPSSTRPSS